MPRSEEASWMSSLLRIYIHRNGTHVGVGAVFYDLGKSDLSSAQWAPQHATCHSNTKIKMNSIAYACAFGPAITGAIVGYNS